MHAVVGRNTLRAEMLSTGIAEKNLTETAAEFDALLLQIASGIDYYIMHAIEGGSFAIIKIPSSILPLSPEDSQLSLAQQFPQLGNIEAIQTATRLSLDRDTNAQDLRSQLRRSLKLGFEFIVADKEHKESLLNGYYLTLKTS